MITLWGNLFRMQFIALFLFETSCKSMAPVCAARATVALSRCDKWQNAQDRRSCCARHWNQMKRRCCHKLWLPFADYACSVTYAGIWQYICIYIYIFIYVAIYLFISLSFTLSMAEKATFSRSIPYSFRQRWFQVNSCNKENVNF